MCYDIKASLEAQLTRATREQDYQAIDEILEKLIPLTDLPIHHTSGFNHPEVLIYTDRSPEFPEVATWGLVPHWVQGEQQQKKLWNATLNARSETIFEKPSYKEAANNNRCILYIDGFYEHHHYEGKTYPFYIHRKDKKPMAIAGLWSDWRNDEGGILTSFTIVTAKGNSFMAKIHNSPKLKEARMPLLLTLEAEEYWLNQKESNQTQIIIEELLTNNNIELESHTVSRLRGKEYIGNVEQITNPIAYKELIF